MKQNIINALKIVFIIIIALWGVYIISFILPGLKFYGIYPRSVSGLTGILASPLIHANITHLMTNTTGIILLGTLFFSLEGVRSKYILIALYLFSGMGTWLIGRSGAVHIGASGVIYGLLGYLLSVGIFTRKLSTIVVSLFVFFIYGGAIWGIFPLIGQPFVSWEAHLAGFIVGIIIARINIDTN